MPVDLISARDRGAALMLSDQHLQDVTPAFTVAGVPDLVRGRDPETVPNIARVDGVFRQ
jgi:hypothetical protein